MGVLKNISIPKKCEKLAEFIGIILGDGHIEYHYKCRGGTCMVRIVGDCTKDYDYLTCYVKNLVEDLFNITPKFHNAKSANALYLSVYSISVVEFIISQGLLPGNKVNNKLIIPLWIKKITVF